MNVTDQRLCKLARKGRLFNTPGIGNLAVPNSHFTHYLRFVLIELSDEPPAFYNTLPPALKNAGPSLKNTAAAIAVGRSRIY